MPLPAGGTEVIRSIASTSRDFRTRTTTADRGWVGASRGVRLLCRIITTFCQARPRHARAERHAGRHRRLHNV